MLWQWGLQVLQAIATFEVGSDSVLWPYIAGIARDLWSQAPERYSRPDLVIAGIAWVIVVGFWSVLGDYVENAKRALEDRSPDPPRGTYSPESDNGAFRCAVTRRHSSAGANPARQLSLQPVAVGADDGGNDIG